MSNIRPASRPNVSIPGSVSETNTSRSPLQGKTPSLCAEGQPSLWVAPSAPRFTINKSLQSLTTLTPVRDNCAGRWTVAVPSSGTVGIYGLTMREGSLEQESKPVCHLSVANWRSDAFIDSFVYDDNPDNIRDTTAVLYYEADGGPEYDHADYGWIPRGELDRPWLCLAL